MIKSMTGFGRAEAANGHFRATVELRSVNHRYADLKLRIPPDLAFLEPILHQRLQKRVARGRVDATVIVSRDGAEAATFEINRSVVASYVQAAEKLRNEFRLEGDVSLNAVLGLPDVLRPRGGADGPAPAEQQAILDAFDRALDQHDAMRSREGEILAKDLKMRLASLRRLAKKVTARAPRLAAQHASRLRMRVRELMGPRAAPALDPGRLAQEVAMLAERTDITEELVRLSGHLDQMEEMLAGREPVGKRLDFILQEMNREANTINSKTTDLAICQTAIEIKAEVEKIREQVQNVE